MALPKREEEGTRFFLPTPKLLFALSLFKMQLDKLTGKKNLRHWLTLHSNRDVKSSLAAGCGSRDSENTTNFPLIPSDQKLKTF